MGAMGKAVQFKPLIPGARHDCDWLPVDVDPVTIDRVVKQQPETGTREPRPPLHAGPHMLPALRVALSRTDHKRSKPGQGRDLSGGLRRQLHRIRQHLDRGRQGKCEGRRVA